MIALIAALAPISCASSPAPRGEITLPDGFSIETYAADVPNARSMALGPGGTLFVGTRSDGRVYAIPDRGGDGTADDVITIASDLNMPNGVAMRDSALYVAEVNRVLRFDDIEDQVRAIETGERSSAQFAVVKDDLPRDTHHGWKFIAFGPDGDLYVPVGAPCNVCERGDTRYASILRMNPDGTGQEVFASGVRNTVGFDWHPGTGELWFTDNGRDWLGDDLPPDELNRAPTPGMHFGFPYCHGRAIEDPDLGREEGCSGFEPPAQDLGPHVAALGMRFYTGTQFPKQYQGQIFIAEHGSWNRSQKLGYRVMLVRLEGNEAVAYEPFAEGWLSGDNVSGRPVDLLVMPDGSMLVSDDHAGAIYRIRYR
jgi:glucose/arabinose dehydrogenase